MQHFKKEVAYVKMDGAIHSFKYPKSLETVTTDNMVLLSDVFPFDESKSFQTFVSLRKQIVKMPLYILETKPALVKRYLIAVEHFYQYLVKKQKKLGITDNALVNQLFLIDTIIDEKNDKVIFTNYSVIALLMKYIIGEDNERNKDKVVDFLKNKNSDATFVFKKDAATYKLTKMYSDNYILGIGIRA